MKRGIVKGYFIPVSYTHLDVYKRQVLYRWKSYFKEILNKQQAPKVQKQTARVTSASPQISVTEEVKSSRSRNRYCDSSVGL